MSTLDRPEVYQRLDAADMLGHIRELPRECETAWRRALGFRLPADWPDLRQVVVLGLGGSAIGGDLLAALVAAECRAAVTVLRDYDLPPTVDERTLVIASSYSGNTEETLSAFAQALATPAKKLALTSGGRLKAMAEENRVPVLGIEYAAPPRAALAHSFIPLIAVCQNLGLIADRSAQVGEAVSLLQRMRAELDREQPAATNQAKQLAEKLRSKVVVIYGAEALSAVARRWKGQVNENAKAWAFYEVFPELNHNAVVGYEFPQEMAERMFVVLLRSPLLHRRTLLRYQATAELLARCGIGHEVVEGWGEGRLAQMMSLLYLGDFTSYYLALLNGTDPSPVKVIDWLKQRLSAQP